MSNRRAIFLTARREIRERLRTRAFVISTAIQVLIVIAIVVISAITAGDSSEKFDVGYVGAEGRTVVEAAEAAEGSVDAEITAKSFGDEQAARAAIEGDDVDAAVVAAGAKRVLVTQSSPSDTLVALLQAAERDVRGAEILRSEGLSESSAEAALHPPPLVLTEVGEGSEGEGIAWVGSLLLYVAILSFGTVVATAVVEEKATRVVEVILSAIRPIQLLTGKVFGIGLLGIGQVMLISGVGIAVALATGSIEMPDSTAETAVLVVVYFLLGYLMYAAAFAVTGAMVSRQEDVQSASAPLVIILIAGYLASISAIGDPSGTLAVVCTFLPPVAPMVVPGRAAQDALPGWELAVSLIAMVAFAVLLLWLAARIYDRAVLRMGAPLKLRQAFGLLRQGSG